MVSPPVERSTNDLVKKKEKMMILTTEPVTAIYPSPRSRHTVIVLIFYEVKRLRVVHSGIVIILLLCVS